MASCSDATGLASARLWCSVSMGVPVPGIRPNVCRKDKCFTGSWDPTFPHALVSMSWISGSICQDCNIFSVGPPAPRQAAVHLCCEGTVRLLPAGLSGSTTGLQAFSLPGASSVLSYRDAGRKTQEAADEASPVSSPVSITLLGLQYLSKNCLKVVLPNWSLPASLLDTLTETSQPPEREGRSQTSFFWRPHTGFGFALGCLTTKEPLTSGHVDKGNKGLSSCSVTEVPPTCRGCPLRHTTVHSAPFLKHTLKQRGRPNHVTTISKWSLESRAQSLHKKVILKL